MGWQNVCEDITVGVCEALSYYMLKLNKAAVEGSL